MLHQMRALRTKIRILNEVAGRSAGAQVEAILQAAGQHLHFLPVCPIFV